MEGLAQVGESWSGYTILEPLGHNGMSERYRVRGEDGRTRLLDILSVRHPDLIVRLQEADLQRVVHPNVLSVHAVVSVLRFPAVVCADSLGEPIGRWLKTDPPHADRMSVFFDLVTAVAALHGAGIVHGFLNPGVIVIERGRRGPIARIGLPGVASVVFRIMREGGAVSTSGSGLANLFQSPEQMRSPDRADLQSDVYALGCLLYWLASGRSPFHKLDPLMAYECSRNETWPPIAELAPDLPQPIAHLVGDLLRAEPMLRPTAAEVESRLLQLLPARRGWGGPVAAVALVVAGVALVALALVLSL